MQEVIWTSEAHGFSALKQKWVVTFCVNQWRNSIVCQENGYLIGANCQPIWKHLLHVLNGISSPAAHSPISWTPRAMESHRGIGIHQGQMTRSNKRKQENEQPPTTTFCAVIAQLYITALYALLCLGHDGKMNYSIWAITKLLCAVSEMSRTRGHGIKLAHVRSW